MYIDINWEARTNGDFRHKLENLIGEIARLENDSSPAAEDRVKQLTVDVYRLCHYNPGFLIPYFFPKFHPTVPNPSPLSLQSRPYAFAIFYFQIGGFIVFRASRQIGKALKDTEPVLTEDGWKSIGDLVEGDTVYDKDGNPVSVTGVFPQGVKNLFRVTFTDGTHVTCCEEHLWLCKTSGAKHWQTKSLKEIRELKGGDFPISDHAIRIPLVSPVKLPAVEHHIHPYFLGVLLGDGSITPGNCGVTSNDPELIDRVNSLQEDIELTPTAHAMHYHIGLRGSKSRYHNVHTFIQELDRMHLRARAEHKMIPDEYLFDSVENRLELLRGLMDTDGSIYGKCQMEYYSTSKKLAEQVQFLVESLGGSAKVKIKDTYYKNDEGTKIPCLPCYRVKFTIQDINPFSLSRKADKFYNIRYTSTRKLKSIEPVDADTATCITVDSPSSTFLTRNCIVTHNSTSIAARQLVNSHIIQKYKSLYVCPHQEFLTTYANRLKDMEREFRFTRAHPDLRSNLKYKEHQNGSNITLVKCLTDSAEARSKTSDEIMYDEYQLLDPDLEPDIEQTQKSSPMPSTVYAGTSTTIESPLECRYQESSQGTWHIRAKDGKNWINCGSEEEVLKIIRPEGPTCPYTGQLLDVRDGTFVHANQRMMLEGQIGFHIPQVIIPEYAHDIIKWREIYRVFRKYDHKKFMQEVLGIPTEEGSREITLQDLKNMCVLPEMPDTLAKKAKAHYYRFIISGCDWGGSDYNPADKTKVSYTVHTIIGITQDWKIHILFFRKYSGMDYRTIANQIAQDHLRFSGNAIGADFGVGGAYNMLLRESGCVDVDRHLIFQYTAPNTAPLSQPANSALYNHYTVNRTESITELFRAIREGEILCHPWEEAKDFLLDLLNMYRIPSETAAGTTGFLYRRHGAKPDDTLHALNFAYVISRIYRKHPIMHDSQLEMTLHRHLGIRRDSGLGGFPGGGLISG